MLSSHACVLHPGIVGRRVAPNNFVWQAGRVMFSVCRALSPPSFPLPIQLPNRLSLFSLYPFHPPPPSSLSSAPHPYLTLPPLCAPLVAGVFYANFKVATQLLSHGNFTLASRSEALGPGTGAERWPFIETTRRSLSGIVFSPVHCL